MAKMSKKAIVKAAMSHALAMLHEDLEECFPDDRSGIWEKMGEISKAKSFEEISMLCQQQGLKIVTADFMIYRGIEKFYQAMLKVVPHLDYPEHSGTECRGWYRVYGAIVRGTGYFCSGDLGRDIDMAAKFLDCGAVTQEQYVTHRANYTIRMGLKSEWQSNGLPDYRKILGFVKPKYQKEVLDCKVLYGFKMMADENADVMAALSI